MTYDSPSIRDLSELDSLLSEPTTTAIRSISQLDGDVLILGAGGKMGPSLARMLRVASQSSGLEHKITAVSRFSNSAVQEQLERSGISTIASDLLEEGSVTRLPDSANIVLMTGSKFGTQQDASHTWAMNVLLPAAVCQRFQQSRILAFSTGNVYPFVTAHTGGSIESDPLEPVGEYGMSAVGRERILEYHARQNNTLMSIVRLNYAVEMRYGVLVDLARKVLAGDPIDISMGYANVIWQGDANAMALSAFANASAEPFIINVAGDEIFSVVEVCERFGEIFDKPVTFTGTANKFALLNDAQQAAERYGSTRVKLDCLIRWTADWLQRDMPTWQKPTHFEVRDGRF